MAPVDYRQLQAPEIPDTDVPNAGYGLKAKALADAFDGFEGIALKDFSELRAHAGEIAGAAAGQTNDPNFKQGLARLTAYGAAYNNAALGAYAIQAQAQLDETAARLRVEANNDPDVFAKTFLAARDGVLKGAPAEAQPELARLWNQRFAIVHGAIVQDQAAEHRDEQQKVYKLGIDKEISRAAMLQGSDNPEDQKAGLDAEVNVHQMIKGGHIAGLFTADQEMDMRMNAMREVSSQIVLTKIDRALANGGDAFGIVEAFRQQHTEDTEHPKFGETPMFTEAQFQQIQQGLIVRIRDYNVTQALAKREGKTAQELRWEAGDVKFTAKLFARDLTFKELSDAVFNGDLKPEVGRSIAQQMTNLVSEPKGTEAAFDKLVHNPRLADMTETEIRQTPGLDSTQKGKAIDERNKQRKEVWNAEDVKVAREHIAAEIRQIKSFGGAALLSEDQQRELNRADVEFKDRLSKLDPSQQVSSARQVADDTIAYFKKQEHLNHATQLQRVLDDTKAAQADPRSEYRIKNDAAYQQRVQDLEKQIAAERAAAK